MFTINAKSSSAATIYIYGDIGESWDESSTTAKQFIDELQALEASEITVRINSIGGSVPDGLAIYNALRRHPAKVTVAIDGLAASIASLIAMAGDRVEMAENSILMIHAPWSVVAGNAEGLREMAETLDLWADAMATSYAAKTGKGVEHARSLLDGQDHYFSASEAVAEGFADEVIEPVAIAASKRIPEQAAARFINTDTLSSQQSEDFLMPQAQATKTPTPSPTPTAAEREQQRQADIRQKFNAFASNTNVSALLGQCLADPAVSVEAASNRLLAELGKQGESVAGGYHVSTDNWHTGPSGADRARDEMTAALVAKAGLANKETLQVASRANARNWKLIDFARASLDRAGISHGHLDAMKLVASAFTQTGSDFPILLENAMHKAMLDAYTEFPDTWSRFCRTGSVSDFRAHGRYRTGSIGNYQVVNEAGEFENIAIPDGEKATITADTQGVIINLTRKAIINDDLGAFMNLAADLGRAGRRTIESAVYALLAENSGLGPNMADGQPLFDATHNNITTGAALSATAIDADRVALGSQKDVSGTEFLYLRPDTLLVAMEQGGPARVINDSQYDPDAANKLQRPNTVRGLFNDVIDTPRLTGTRRYMFASPNQAPVIEVAFLNGESSPFIEQQDGFTVDGAQMKGRLDFGVAAIDYRGAVTNTGA